MDVTTTPVNLEVPSTVTIPVPKQIVLDRNVVLIVAGGVAAVYLINRFSKERQFRKQVKKFKADVFGAIPIQTESPE